MPLRERSFLTNMSRGKRWFYWRKNIESVTRWSGEEGHPRPIVLHRKMGGIKFKETKVVYAELKNRDKIFCDVQNMKEIVQMKTRRRGRGKR